VSAQDVKSSKALFIGARVFMQVTKKGNAFFIYVLPTSKVELLCHDIPSQYKEFKDMFERKTLTPYQSIVHMIALLILKRGHSLHLSQSTTYHKTNLQIFMNTSMKTLKRGSLDIPSL
jgi:hypothetical protein